MLTVRCDLFPFSETRHRNALGHTIDRSATASQPLGPKRATISPGATSNSPHNTSVSPKATRTSRLNAPRRRLPHFPLTAKRHAALMLSTFHMHEQIYAPVHRGVDNEDRHRFDDLLDNRRVCRKIEGTWPEPFAPNCKPGLSSTRETERVRTADHRHQASNNRSMRIVVPGLDLAEPSTNQPTERFSSSTSITAASHPSPSVHATAASTPNRFGEPNQCFG